MAWACLAVLAGCAGLARDDQGLLQPQSVRGPCEVKKFYILNFTAVNTDMTASGTCTFTVLDPNLQIVLNSAAITTPASHGRAEAGLPLAGRQGQVSYTPQPGYAGQDEFVATFEPNDKAIRVHVTVQRAP